MHEHEKARRAADYRAFQRRVNKEGDAFMSRIITTDETWLWFYDPETKSQSAVWNRTGSPPPKKARVSKCGGKYMFIMFADMHGMILQHAVPQNTTVNADYFCKVCIYYLLIVSEKDHKTFINTISRRWARWTKVYLRVSTITGSTPLQTILFLFFILIWNTHFT